MLWKLIILIIIVFIITLLVCKVIIGLVQHYLSNKNYKLAQNSSFILTCIVILIVGIVFGKDFLYIIL